MAGTRARRYRRRLIVEKAINLARRLADEMDLLRAFYGPADLKQLQGAKRSACLMNLISATRLFQLVLSTTAHVKRV